MVDVQTVSVAIASMSIVLAAIYYVLQLRHQAKTKTIDLAVRLDAIWESRDFLESWITFRERDPKEYDTYSSDNLRKWMAEMHIGNFFGALGVLVRKKLVDLDLVCNLFPIVFTWEKLRFYVEKVRKEYNSSASYEEFEYLYNEAKNREQKLQLSKT
jgi:hypothetical protein